jgi:hypothetical protein
MAATLTLLPEQRELLADAVYYRDPPVYCPVVSDCLILGANQAFTREVPMDDPKDPYSRDNLSWNWSRGGPWSRPFSGRSGRGPRVPPPPGPPPKRSKAEREQEKRAEARAERLHLAALTNAGVIIIGVVLAAVVVMVVLALVNRH